MKTWIILGITVLFGVGLFISTQLEASTVEEPSLDLESMIVLALEDEYHAKATYEVIIEQYGEITPFTNIVQAEETHIQLLLPLFESYDITLPEAFDKDTLDVPSSIDALLQIGIDAEIANIALYEAFLETDLPNDVQIVFQKLMAASENHLNAFTKALQGSLGQGNSTDSIGLKNTQKHLNQRTSLEPKCGA
jgi:hypothetical protein